MAHLYAFGIYAICVAGSELARLTAEPRPFRIGPWQQRIKLVGIGMSLLAPASLLALSPASSDAAVTRWSSWTWKTEAMLSPIFFDQPWIELPLFLMLVTLVGAGLMLRILRVSSSMIPALVIFSFLLVVMPRTLYGSNYADYRLLSGIGFFLVASLRFTPRSPDWRAPMIAAGCLCLIVRVGSILGDWIPAQTVLAEYETALAKVPPGSKLLVLLGSIGSASANRSPPLEHVPVFAAAKQRVLVGYTFAGPSTPLKLRREFVNYEQFAPYPSLATDMAKFDYVMTVYEPKFDIPAGLSLTPVSRGQSYQVKRIERSATRP